MHKNDTLQHILSLIENRSLGRALQQLENYLLANPNKTGANASERMNPGMEQLVAIKDDYRLMSEYWQRGFDDPQRQQVFDNLLRRLYVLTRNIAIHDWIRSSSFMKSVYQRPRQVRKDWSLNSIRRALETFVSDVALLELEPNGEQRQKRSEQTYHEHQLLMHDLFDYILTSRLWNEPLTNTFTELLLSPTIDARDQQLIVSAITLSALQTFGLNKVRILADVYRQTQDQQLRQRTLVGWVLCLNAAAASVYPELKQMVASLVEDETCRQEITELQLQMIYCLEAESDQRIIKDEIMPDLINGSNIKVTQKGLVEMDEDTLEDILHPEAAEQNMERLEQSMQRMADMQKQGSDIYYAGFAQMKRFQFFNDLSNWFVPFYPQHPIISSIWQKTKGKKFLQIITRVGAFCDSDKYSFVLAFEQVLARLPQSMLKMVEDGEAMPTPVGGEISIEDQRQPAFIRRAYLQNIYRFFRLHPCRSEFRSPFDSGDSTDPISPVSPATSYPIWLFFANPLFQGTQLEACYLEVASFLLKRKRLAEALSVLKACTKPKDEYQYQLLLGNTLLRMSETPLDSASEHFRIALQLRPDSERVLTGYARATFREENYQEALKAYERLLELQPESRSYLLNHAICLSRLQRSEEALKGLFKLNYLYPDDKGVNRVLAWTLTENGRTEQAQKLYATLLADEHPEPGDMLNNAYCLWFARQIVDAISMFRQYIASFPNDQQPDMGQEFFSNEHSTIARQNISDTEIQLMLDSFID